MIDVALIVLAGVAVLVSGWWFLQRRKTKSQDRGRYGKPGHYKWGDLPEHQEYPEFDVSDYTDTDYHQKPDGHTTPDGGPIRVRDAKYITANHAANLERQVVHLLKYGYQPVGAPIASPDFNRYVQLMVRLVE